MIGQFLAQGPYFPLLELQARWIVAVWSGEVALPADAAMRQVMARPRPPLDAHNALALTLSEELGVAPEPLAWDEICEPLMFGPLLPPRYRLSGPRRTGAGARALHDPTRGVTARTGRADRPGCAARLRLDRDGRAARSDASIMPTA